MCQFLSALILANGDVLTHPMLDSHTDLVTWFNLRDDRVGRFAKVELVPGEDTWLDPDQWTWVLDEPTRPAWLTEDMEANAQRALRDRAKRMILKDGEHTLIVDGCWIVGGTAVVKDVRGGRLVHVRGSAQITDVGDSAQITDVGDSAQITHVWGSAQITDVGGSANLDDSAKAHLTPTQQGVS